MALYRKRKSFSLVRFFSRLLLILLVVFGGTAFFLFFERSKPSIDLTSIPQFIGKTHTFDIRVADSDSGLRQVKVTATQGDSTKELYSVTNQRRGYTGQIGPASDHPSITFDAKKLGFNEGPVRFTVTAYDFSWMNYLKGNSTTASIDATIDSKPPVITLLHSEQYISPGGAGIVIYSIDDKESTHGAIINGRFHPGHPVSPGSNDKYIAYFALPYDTESLSESYVKATDTAGNTAMLPFSTIFQNARQKHDRINISDNFLSVKIPEFKQYYPEMSGSLLEQYLYTNSTLRDQNNAQIAEICTNSSDERFWSGHFLRMPGSNRAGFADHRTYYYNGQPIDKQVHLGMDIASTQQATVAAANAGKVVFADYLGIYGNMVIIDHGQGVFSLYSHLSQINVKAGDMVTSNDTIGLTGHTGMAGGDHLHFSMLVNGIFTTPLEWWDPHWIRVTIEQPLASLNIK